jgi:DNA modification methylase
MKNQKAKFKKLRCLEKRGVELSSVWNFGSREHGFGSHVFHGNCIPQVVKQCVLRYSKKKDLILDSMSGSGTTLDVCKSLSRTCLAYDINPTRNDILKADAADLPLSNNRVSMIFIHLPYWNMVKYSNEKEDLSKQSLDGFYAKLHSIFIELKRVLKPEGHICVLIGDKIKDGKNIPLCFETYNILSNYFAYKDYAVKITKNSTSTVNKGRVVLAELTWNNLLKPSHDLLLVFQKEKN